MLTEFKKFISRGNVIDMAVGIIIGAAFTGIVKSLVDDVIMPPIGVIMGGIDFKDYFVSLSGEHYETLAAAQAAGAATLNYGLFINNVVNFLIVAFAVFMLIKQVHRFKQKEEESPTVAPPRQEVLLEEIRDLMKQNRH